MTRIMRIDPEIVVIAMNSFDTLPRRKGIAAIDGNMNSGIQVVNPVRVNGVDQDLAEIERPPCDIVVLVNFYPALSPVIRSNNGTFSSFDKRIDNICISPEIREGDASEIAFREAIVGCFPVPRLTSIMADIHTGTWPA